MTISDMIRGLCEKQNISLAELCKHIDQIPQNFNKKLKRGTVFFEEMMAIAKALDVTYEQVFVLPNVKNRIRVINEVEFNNVYNVGGKYELWYK